MTDIPTLAEMSALLAYDPETGLFTWKPRAPEMFVCAKHQKRECLRWNNRHAGNIAGHVNSKGYVSINIFGKQRKAHRLAILFTTGNWPKKDIDHINMNKADNRISNLREATRQENVANSNLRASNKSGIKGVWSHRIKGKWVAGISTKHIGVFDCPAAASFAYQIKAHELYGEFARVA